MDIKIGDTIELSEVVNDDNTANAWGSGSLSVYATPAMILLIEKAAVKLLDGKLDNGMTSVGTKLDVAHIAATPVGCEITCRCTLIEIERKRLDFQVEVRDNKGRIGIGTHERFIVDSESFTKKTQSKLD